MSNVSKKNDAGDAALSAIEEALNLAAKEAQPLTAVTHSEAPKKKLKIERPIAVDDDIFADTPVVPPQDVENEPNSYIAPIAPIRPANDEKSDLGQLLYSLSKKPSNTPYWIASAFAALWVTIAFLVVTSNNMTSTGVGLLTATCLVVGPVLIIFGFAYMMIRASEMRLVARGMTEVAMRLAEPESVARDAVASVGQAVRREVEAMNTGVTQTLRHATELETRVSNEVKMIEEAFLNNESRIRDLVSELSSHRAALSNQTNEAQGVLSLAHQSLISELSSRSHDLKSVLETTQADLISRLTHHNSSLTDNLTATTAKVLGEFQNKSQSIGDNLLQAGNSVMDTIHMRTADILDKLSHTGEDVTGSIKNSSQEIITTIAKEVSDIRVSLDNAAGALTGSLTEHSDAMTTSLHAIGTEVSGALARTGAEVTDAISLRAGEVNQTLKHTGDSLVLDLGLRGSEVTQKLDETGTRIAEYITDRGNALADRINETGNKLYETVNVYGADLDRRLAATGENIAEALATRTTEAQRTISEVGLHVVDTLNEKALGVQSALHLAGEQVSTTMTERAGLFKADLESVGSGMIDQFTAQSNDITDRFSLLSSDFSAKFKDDTQKIHSISQKLGDSVAEMSGVINNHVSGFDDLSSRLSLDVALKLTESTAGMADKIRAELTHFDKTVTDKTVEVSGTLDERITRLDKTLALGASDISKSLAERAIEIATALSNGGASVTAIMEEKSLEMSAALTKRAEDINEALGQKAMEVASSLNGSVNRIGQVSEYISEKTGNLAALFDEKGSVFLTNLSEKSDHLSGEISKISDIAVNTLEQKGALITHSIALKTVEMSEAMKNSALELSKQVSTSTEGAMTAIAFSQERISAHMGPLLGNLNETNETLKTLATNAQHNLMLMDEKLGQRVNDLQKVVDNVTYAAETGVSGLDKQVIALQAVSGGTFTTLTDLTGRIEKQTSDLNTLNKYFDDIQSNFNNIMEDRRSKLEQLVNHMGDRGQNMEEMLVRFNTNIGQTLTTINTSISDQLAEAQSKAKNMVELLASAGKDQSNSLANHVATLATQSNEMINFIGKLEKEQTERLAEQVTGLKQTYNQEREVSQQQIQKAYDATLNNIDALYIDSSSKFNELTQNLRQVSSDIGRELEATRAELKRGLIDMPRETQEQAAAMRRVVADQMKALAELNDIVSKSGRTFDVAQTNVTAPRYSMQLKATEPVISERLPEPKREVRREIIPEPRYEPKPEPVIEPEYVAPVTIRRPSPPPVMPAPVATPKKKEGWLSDILARASNEEPETRREPSFSEKRPSDTDLIDQLADNILNYIDHQTAIDLWEKYRRGESKIFNRRLYTTQGQKAFDDIRARYSRSEEFRNETDRYIDEFERMLTEINKSARDPAITRNALVSNTGKTYTILAHASGRFDA